MWRSWEWPEDLETQVTGSEAWNTRDKKQDQQKATTHYFLHDGKSTMI